MTIFLKLMKITFIDFDKWMLYILYQNRIDVIKGIDAAKSNNSKECMVCYYWHFSHGLEFQDYVCNSFSSFTRLFVNISNIAIAIKRVGLLLSYC